MTLDDLKADFEILDGELREFYEDNKDVIGKYKELKTQRAEAISKYAEEARKQATADSRKTGMLTVGHFEFMLKNKTEIDKERLLGTPEGRKAAALGLFKIRQEFVENDTNNLAEFLKDPEVVVVLDEKKLKDLDKAKELQIPKDCVSTTPMTPALQKGPKPEDY